MSIILGIDEQWRSVASVGGRIEVSSCGRLRNSTTKRLRSLSLDRDGYAYASVYIGGGRASRVIRKVLVHRAVLEAFIGPCPQGMETRHIDGDPSNNRLANLQWSSHRDNCHDKVQHGTVLRGERHPCAKLNWASVARIRACGKRERAALAMELGIHLSVLYDVLRNKTWRME